MGVCARGSADRLAGAPSVLARMWASCRHRTAGASLRAAVVRLRASDHLVIASLRAHGDVCRERRSLRATQVARVLGPRGAVRLRVLAGCQACWSDITRHDMGEQACDRSSRAPTGTRSACSLCDAEGVSCDTGEMLAGIAVGKHASNTSIPRRHTVQSPAITRSRRHTAPRVRAFFLQETAPSRANHTIIRHQDVSDPGGARRREIARQPGSLTPWCLSLHPRTHPAGAA